MKTLVRSVSLALFVLAVDGCLPGPGPGQDHCRTIRIESTYVGQAWANAGASFFDPVTMSVPGVLRVVGAQQGLTALVTFTTSNGDVQCNYQQANPGSLRLTQCSAGLAEGTSVSARDVRMHVEGAGAVGSSVVVADFAEAHVCATGTWLQTNPHFTRHEPGVDDDVSYVGDIEKYVMSSRGVVEHLQSFRAREHRARSRRYGALEPEADAYLRRANPLSAHAVAGTFKLDLNWSDLTRGLASTVAAERAAARTLLRNAVTLAQPGIHSTLTALGATEVHFSPHEPLVFAQMQPSAIRALANRPEMSLVRVDFPHAPQLTVASNGTQHAKIDSVFNTGLEAFGAGLRAGTDELGSACALFANHDAFAFGPIVNYQLPQQPADRQCIDDLDCQFRCGPETDVPQSAFCVDTNTSAGRRCSALHANATASMVLAARGGEKFGAARAAFYNFNRSTNCREDAFTEAFGWFADGSVNTVYESFVCPRLIGSPSAQDLFARDFNISIFRAADNYKSNQACPHTNNAVCVGASNADDSLWVTSPKGPDVGSSFINPTTDREEPDIVTLGVDVIAGVPRKDSPSTSYTTTVTGTSIATPNVAAASLLLREACGRADFDQRQMRAILMASSWSRNADGWRYSTPGIADTAGIVHDHKDGAGVLDSQNLVAFCGGSNGQPRVTSGILIVDVFGTPSLPPLPRLTPTTSPPGDPGGPPGGGATGKSKAPPSDRLSGIPYWSQSLPAGARVRTTFAWDACPGMNRSRVSTDFDVLLCSEAKCLFASRSFDDNNEGMDVVVDSAGTWTLWAVHPTPIDAGIYTLAYGCRGSAIEPAAFAVVWGAF